MKISLNTFGTRGDIQPYIALGLGLQASGHQVLIHTHQIFSDFVKGYHLDFVPVDLDPRQVQVNQALTELGNNTIRITRWMKRHFTPVLREMFAASLDANKDSDLIINSGLSFVGWHVAEKLHIPSLAAFLWPVTPSRHLEGAAGRRPPPWLPFKGLANFATTKFFNQLFYNLMLPSINECRVDILDLPPLRPRDYWQLDSPRHGAPILYGYSEAVVPKPPDWTDLQQATGYWFLDTPQDYQPDHALLDFLSVGPPPVYIGFGSLVDHDQERLTLLILAALNECNCRGILLGGWSGFGAGSLPGNVISLDAVPHDWLFPHMAAVVHHGGAGTTAAGFRAGVPTVIVPSFGDQFFWGWQVQKIGAGPPPIPRTRLTVEALAAAIQQAVSDTNLKEKTQQIGQKIRAENGVENAVKIIERFAKNGNLS